jgi:hypothetical protein
MIMVWFKRATHDSLGGKHLLNLFLYISVTGLVPSISTCWKYLPAYQ